MKRYSRLIAACAGAGALCAASEAKAANCNFSGDNIVYVGGSSASAPVFQYISPVLAQAGVQLVYIQSESCTGVDAMTRSNGQSSSPVSISQDPLASSATAALTATTWAAGADGGAPTATKCSIAAPGTAGANPTQDIAFLDASVSDVFASTCGEAPQTGQQEFGGPVQAMAIIANGGSGQTNISARAAHVVFGDLVPGTSQTYPVSPWTNPEFIFIREPIAGGGSGTRLMIGTAIGLTDTQWSTAIANPADGGAATNVLSGSGALVTAITAANVVASQENETASLGTLSTTIADTHRVGNTLGNPAVKVLAFQGSDQTCGFYPDSTASTFDKINVREGRYEIWGQLHFITAVAAGDGGVVPVSSSNVGNATANAALQTFVNFISLVTGSTLTDTQKQSVIAAEATASVVSQCAMKVQRTQEIGPEVSFLPPESCGCYWESVATGSAPASCQTCSMDGDCASDANTTATPTCRYGFCEAN